MTMKTHHSLRLPVLLLLCCLFSVGAGRAWAGKRPAIPVLTWMDCELNFQHLTVNDGLLSNAIRSISQDHYGRLWIGSGRGVDIYDGHRFTSRKVNDMNVTVYSLCEGDGRMWIGTALGLFYLDFETDSIHAFRRKTKHSELPIHQVLSILHDRRGDLWFTSYGQGIFHLNRSSGVLTCYTLPGDDRRACSLLLDSEGRIWSFRTAGTDCLDLYNPRSDRFETYSLTLDGQPLDVRGRALTQDAQGTIYLGTTAGTLYAFTPGSHEARQMDLGEGFGGINSIIAAGSEEVILSSEAGLALVNSRTGALHRITSDSQKQGSLSDQLALPLFIDREETLWVGTFFGGLNYTHLEFSNFVPYVPTKTFDIAGKFVSSFAEDGQGRIWIGCEDGGLSVFDPATKTIERRPKQDLAKNVQSLSIQGEEMAIGTYRNGFLLENLATQAQHHYPQLNDGDGNYLENSARTVFTDDEGTVWLGTYDMIASFDPDNGTLKVHQRETSAVNHICQDADGNLWFSTSHRGVWRYDRKHEAWRNFNGKDYEDDAYYTANTIHCDDRGRLWLGMSQGLYRYDPEQEHFHLESEELSSLEILDIIDIWDQLWMTTSVGIVHYFPDSDRATQVFRSGSNGLQNTDFVQGAFFRASDSTFYAGTSDGFVTFYPRTMQYNDVVPHLRFTGFDLFGQPAQADSTHHFRPILLTDTIILNPDENVFRVYFSAMSFVNPKDNRYRYYLEGFDQRWMGGKESFATYTNLPAGTYVLHVEGTNNDGVWSTEEARLTIIVLPPFYWSTPAKLLYALAALLLIVFLLRARKKGDG